MNLTVVKLGGSLLEDAVLRESALEAIALRWRTGEPLVVVHGGGKHVDASLAKLGIPRKTQGGLRVTDAETLPVVVGVLTGNVNKMLVSELIARGVRAAGISGADGETVAAEVHAPVEGVDLGFVGKTTAADPQLINTLLAADFMPVVASLAIGPEGQLLNVNADSAASAIAASLGASRLVFLTDVEGLRDENGGIVRRIGKRDAEGLLNATHVSGGMLPKLRACLDAIQNGVGQVIIAGPSTHASSLIEGVGGTHLVAA